MTGKCTKECMIISELKRVKGEGHLSHSVMAKATTSIFESMHNRTKVTCGASEDSDES